MIANLVVSLFCRKRVLPALKTGLSGKHRLLQIGLVVVVTAFLALNARVSDAASSGAPSATGYDLSGLYH